MRKNLTIKSYTNRASRSKYLNFNITFCIKDGDGFLVIIVQALGILVPKSLGFSTIADRIGLNGSKLGLPSFL